MDVNRKIVNANKDEPLRTQYDYSPLPIIFCNRDVFKRLIAHDTISSFIDDYAIQNDIHVSLLDRGFVDIELNTPHDVCDASDFIRIVQDRCGMNVYCIEEVAWRRGFIDLEQMKKISEKYGKTDYGKYVHELLSRMSQR